MYTASSTATTYTEVNYTYMPAFAPRARVQTSTNGTTLTFYLSCGTTATSPADAFYTPGTAYAPITYDAPLNTSHTFYYFTSSAGASLYMYLNGFYTDGL
jgi:hypothetical protein